jgi:hypothetical protein
MRGYSAGIILAVGLFLSGCANELHNSDDVNKIGSPAELSGTPSSQEGQSKGAETLTVEEQSAEFLPLSNDDWITYYYFHKNEEGLKAVFDDLLRTKDFDKQDEKTLMTKYAFTGFLTGLFLDNPTKVDVWLKGRKFKGEPALIIAGSLLMAGMPEKIATYTDVPQPAASEKTGMTLLQMPLEHPFMPILLTYAFSGSGNTAYLDRMVDGVQEKISLGAGQEQKKAMRHYLIYRLFQSRYEHVLVENFLKDKEEKGNFSLDTALLDLRKAHLQKTKMLDEQDSSYKKGLSAQLLLLDSAQMTGTSGKKKLESIKSIKSQQEFGVALSFQGMKLSPTGEASVRYDFSVKNSAGQEIIEMGDKDVVAMQSKTPTRFMPFTPRIIPILSFMKDMPSGTYTVTVIVKDLISGQKQTISQQIQLQGRVNTGVTS